MNSYALVLAGGGGKGAYQIGAWKALSDMGITFSAVAGTSIGSINGALILGGDYEKATALWKNVSLDKGIKITEELPDKDNLFSKKNWSVLFKEVIKKGGFDASPAAAFVSEYIDENAVRKSGVPFYIVTVQMTDGVTPREIELHDIPETELVDYLMASSNIPLAVGIGPEGEKFLDGGVYDNIPLTTLRKRGFNRLIVIDISNHKGIGHSLNIYNSQTIYIRPYDIEVLGDFMGFDEASIERRLNFGYLDAQKAFSLVLGNIYYFSPVTFNTLLVKYGADALLQLEKLAYYLKMDSCKIYEEDEFILSLKELYENNKAEEVSEETERTEPEVENETWLSSIRKRFNQRRNSEDFPEALAILEKI